MGDKKHIDRLFQERFKDFEVTPNSEMWRWILYKLGHKKKRRLIPFWLQLGGIAAAITLLFMLGYRLFSEEENKLIEPQIVNEKVKKDALPTSLENENANTNEKQNEITIDGDIVDNKKNNTPSNRNNESKVVVAKPNSTDTSTERDTNIKTNVVAVQKKIKETPAVKKSKLTDKNIGLTKNERVAANSNTSALKAKIIDNDSYKKDARELTNATDTKNAVAALAKKEKQVENKETAQKPIINKETELKNSATVTSVDTDATKKDEGKEENKLPSILNTIDQEEKNTDIAKVATSNNKRWSLNPMVAPVYYNAVGEGSPIDAQFNDNAKSGDINLSYGVGVAYQLSKRLSVRSGVNVVNLGYDTEEIAFTASLNGGNLENIRYNSNTSRIDVKDRSPNSMEAADVSNDFSTNRGLVETAGVMRQQFGYVEVPLELKYRLVDKKIGINVIGGLSSLFLTDNSISLESANLITDVGEANNVNNTSFTTNVGLGIDYALNKNLELNLEPIFKYQLNAFNREAGNFQPFYMGLYTGVSFKF